MSFRSGLSLGLLWQLADRQTDRHPLPPLCVESHRNRSPISRPTSLSHLDGAGTHGKDLTRHEWGEPGDAVSNILRGSLIDHVVPEDRLE